MLRVEPAFKCGPMRFSSSNEVHSLALTIHYCLVASPIHVPLHHPLLQFGKTTPYQTLENISLLPLLFVGQWSPGRQHSNGRQEG